MTEDFVPFVASLVLAPSSAVSGTLILEKDNPSGLPEHADELRMPVRLEPNAEMTSVNVYFPNSTLDQATSCTAVFPVKRTIPKTDAIGRKALEFLLAGPTPAEIESGYSTTINPGVSILRLAIEQGIASVDFDNEIEHAVGGSCRVTAIRAQISATLKQFPTVREVRISVNGRAEDILQP